MYELGQARVLDYYFLKRENGEKYLQLLKCCTETLTKSKSGCIGAGNSASSLVVGIHMDRRPFVTSVRDANVRISFSIASNPYGFLGAMYPGRLEGGICG